MFEENKIPHTFVPTQYRSLLVTLATTLALQAQLILIKIVNFTNITSHIEDPQSTLGDGENIMLASTVQVGNDR